MNVNAKPKERVAVSTADPPRRREAPGAPEPPGRLLSRKEYALHLVTPSLAWGETNPAVEAAAPEACEIALKIR